MHDTTAESILCPHPPPPPAPGSEFPPFVFRAKNDRFAYRSPPSSGCVVLPVINIRRNFRNCPIYRLIGPITRVFFFFLFLVFIFSSTYTFPTLSFISKRNLDSCAGGWLFPGGKDWRWIALQWENTAGLFQFGASGWFLSNLTGLEEDPFSNRSILHFLISSIRSNLCIHSEDTVQWFSTRAICKRETASIYIYNQERSEKNYYSYV